MSRITSRPPRSDTEIIALAAQGVSPRSDAEITVLATAAIAAQAPESVQTDAEVTAEITAAIAALPADQVRTDTEINTLIAAALTASPHTVDTTRSDAEINALIATAVAALPADQFQTDAQVLALVHTVVDALHTADQTQTDAEITTEITTAINNIPPPRTDAEINALITTAIGNIVHTVDTTRTDAEIQALIDAEVATIVHTADTFRSDVEINALITTAIGNIVHTVDTTRTDAEIQALIDTSVASITHTVDTVRSDAEINALITTAVTALPADQVRTDAEINALINAITSQLHNAANDQTDAEITAEIAAAIANVSHNYIDRDLTMYSQLGDVQAGDYSGWASTSRTAALPVGDDEDVDTVVMKGTLDDMYRNVIPFATLALATAYAVNYWGAQQVGYLIYDRANDQHYKFNEAQVLEKFPNRPLTYLTGSGRHYLYTNNRWITSSDDNYGENYYQIAENAGTGTNPVVEWEHLGTFLPAGTQLNKLNFLARASTGQLTELKIQVIVRTSNRATKWKGLMDNDSHQDKHILFNGNFQTGMSGDFSDLRNAEMDLGNYVMPKDGMVSIYIKPVGTLTATKYLYSTWTYEMIGAKS